MSLVARMANATITAVLMPGASSPLGGGTAYAETAVNVPAVRAGVTQKQLITIGDRIKGASAVVYVDQAAEVNLAPRVRLRVKRKHGGAVTLYEIVHVDTAELGRVASVNHRAAFVVEVK